MSFVKAWSSLRYAVDILSLALLLLQQSHLFELHPGVDFVNVAAIVGIRPPSYKTPTVSNDLISTNTKSNSPSQLSPITSGISGCLT